jgi:tol-pal system protein YbgF
MIFRARAAAFGMLMASLAVSPSALALFGDDVARKQVAEQQKRLDELRQFTEGVASRLGRLEEEAARAPQVLSLAAEIQKLRDEIRGLRGEIETLANNIDGVAKRQRDMYVDLDQRLRRFEQPAAASTAVPAPSAAATAETAKPAAVPGGANEENEVYERAQVLRRAGNYPAAIAAFQSFIAKYPKSTLAPRAQYWIGDSQFNQREFKAAIASQQRLLAAYPDSSSVPDALLNLASAQLESGDSAAARKTMDGLIARFPASEAAEKARRRIGSLR